MTQPRRTATRAHALLLLGAVLLVGCGSAKSATVSGTVTLDGQPLADAAVSFQPTDSLNPGPGSTGRTNAKGEYSLQIIGGGQGAHVGNHRVEISCPVTDGKVNPDDDRPTRMRDKVPLQYNVQSKLTRAVKPGHNTHNFDLSSKESR